MADSLAGSDNPAGLVDLAGLVLAAGEGSRLRPLTSLRPKPLCPVGDVAMVDHALAAVGAVVGSDALAVNVHHGIAAMESHLGEWSRRVSRRVHVSVERDAALGTAGAVGNLRGWLDGRALLVANADAWHRAGLHELVDAWDGLRPAVLTDTAGPFGARSSVVASILPAGIAGGLGAEPAGLWELVWRGAVAEGRMQTVHTTATVIDCGTPAGYLRANLDWAAGAGPGRPSRAGQPPRPDGSVVGDGAVVEGSVERCVVWPDARVGPTEHLVDAIRADRLTVLVR